MKIRKRGYLQGHQFRIAWKNWPMTKLARCRFLWRDKKQFGRHNA